MNIDRNQAIDALFHPRNVVLVGASDRAGHWSQRVFGNLKRFGFAGKIFPVNPNRSGIWGMPCYPRLDALPEPADHLAIFTPAETTLHILDDGGAVGARTATVYASGFGEGGNQDGRRLGGQLRDAIDRSGVGVIGPNCMGAACGAARFSSIPDESLQPLAPSTVAVVLQSGAMCTTINRAINDLGLKAGYLASCGSQIGFRISDFIEYYAAQPGLRVIFCYVEGILDAEAFLTAARRAKQNGMTVVAVKVGASEASRATALAHTGSLAGSVEAFDAVAGSAGVIRFNSFEDAIEAVEFLARLPLPKGDRIAVMSNSGALRSLVTEAAERTGATLAVFSESTKGALSKILGQDNASNPLDTIRTIPVDQYAACLDVMVDAPEVDNLLIAEDMPLDATVERRAINLRAVEALSDRATAAGKRVALFAPLLVSPTKYGRAVRAELPNVPLLRETERSLRIVSALARAAARPVHVGSFLPPPANTERVRRWRARAAKLAQPTVLNEIELKALLAEYGIGGPPERLAHTPDEAAEAAGSIGFPVVLKAVSAALPHKSDAGLVRLGLASAEVVRQAAVELVARASSLGAMLDGMLVAKQVSNGTEVVLGVQRDVEMGPVVMFGMGGVLVELFKDVSFAAPTLDDEQARAMVLSTRAGRLLTGFRGRPSGDLNALCNALVNLGSLARELGDAIESIDVNPLLVKEQGVVALDALVVMRPPNSQLG